MFQKPSSSQTPNKFAVENNRNSNRTQMAAEIKTTAAMPPLTAITGLTHNGRSARYGIKPAHVNFRLANTENVCSSVARARLLFLLGPAPSAPSRTQRSRVSARPCPPCNRPWTCHHRLSGPLPAQITRWRATQDPPKLEMLDVRDGFKPNQYWRKIRRPRSGVFGSFCLES